ncbi:copper chaperone PCu(A)C [Crenobacter cavernae]|uniref:Copper chaperone PCu(A)C n=1 Tax=Crenobacter cavernae TaxID=2290923 RepID=A0ABY0FHR0_9NEIS|nr:copper chaperone PCu(A)C [Crenobacter cavernae]RXZ44436.1 copper chaperone PCu(A)C [Crenobacter cavernae]
MKAHLAALALAALPLFAHAHDFTAGSLHIDHPWSRSTAPGAATGAAYFALENRGRDADTLIGASTPRAARAEIHEHVHDKGVMRMRQVSGGVKIAPGGTVRFEPGGYHLMLNKLSSPLKAGERFPLTLEFAKAGKVKVEVAVDGSQHKADEHAGH